MYVHHWFKLRFKFIELWILETLTFREYSKDSFPLYSTIPSNLSLLSPLQKYIYVSWSRTFDPIVASSLYQTEQWLCCM